MLLTAILLTALTLSPTTIYRHHARTPPALMMASPLRVRERSKRCVDWAKGIVVNVQNVLLERSGAAGLVGLVAGLTRPPVVRSPLHLRHHLPLSDRRQLPGWQNLRHHRPPGLPSNQSSLYP